MPAIAVRIAVSASGSIADTAIRLGLLSLHQAEEAWQELASRKVPAEEFLRAFAEVDAILTPTSPVPAFKLGEKTGDPLATRVGLATLADGTPLIIVSALTPHSACPDQAWPT